MRLEKENGDIDTKKGLQITSRCSNCMWVDKFEPRQDEIDRGLTIGCKKPGWESYTRNGSPACDGVFFVQHE